MASPAPYIVTSQYKYGCPLVCVNNPLYYEIYSGSNLTLTIDVTYNGVAKSVVQRMTPDSNGIVRFDLSNILQPMFKTWLNYDHTDGTQDDSNYINLTSFQFSFVDEDSDGGNSGILYILNSRNPITYKNGQSANNLVTAWQSKEEIPLIGGNIITDLGIDNNDYILRFKEDIDFTYAGAINLYYKLSTEDTEDIRIIVLDELQPDKTITTTNKIYGIDFSTKEGVISFTKTENRWVRAYIVKATYIYTWAFIDSSPILTMFDKIKYYNLLPMDVSINFLVNQTISGEVNEIGYRLRESDFIQTLNSTILRINLNIPAYIPSLVIEVSTNYIDGQEGNILSRSIGIDYFSFLPNNPIYLGWLNSKGGYDYYLFSKTQTIDYTTQGNKEIMFSNVWGANETMMEVKNQDVYEVITCGAESVSISELLALKDLILSPFVVYLSNPLSWKWEGCKWINVSIEKKQFEYNTEKAAGKIELDVILNRYYK